MQPATDGERFVRLIELTNVVLALLAIVAVHVFAGAGPLLWGTLIGALIGVLNLRAMVFIGRRLLGSTPGKRHVWGILFTAKLIVLSTVVWLCLSMLPVDSIGFLIGFSTLLPGALIATFIRTLERTTPAPSNPASTYPRASANPNSYGERRP